MAFRYTGIVCFLVYFQHPQTNRPIDQWKNLEVALECAGRIYDFSGTADLRGARRLPHCPTKTNHLVDKIQVRHSLCDETLMRRI
jgi:hypothetical protein